MFHAKGIGCIKKFSCWLQLTSGKPPGGQRYWFFAKSEIVCVISLRRQYFRQYSIISFDKQYEIFPYSRDKHDDSSLRHARAKRMATLSPQPSPSSAKKRYALKKTVTSSSILFNEIHPEKWKQPFHWWYKSETSFPGGAKREIRYSAERRAILRGEITIKGRSAVWNNSCIFYRAEMFLCDTFHDCEFFAR